MTAIGYIPSEYVDCVVFYAIPYTEEARIVHYGFMVDRGMGGTTQLGLYLEEKKIELGRDSLDDLPYYVGVGFHCLPRKVLITQRVGGTREWMSRMLNPKRGTLFRTEYMSMKDFIENYKDLLHVLHH
jgi:hypothetical protein